MEDKKYLTVREMVKKYPFFTEASLRHLIHDNKHNIKTTIMKIGGRLFFDVERFDAWVQKRRIEKED